MSDMRTPLAILHGTMVLTAIVLQSSAAYAYVRYHTSAGLPYKWAPTCVAVTVYPADLPEMTPAQILHATTAAAEAWSTEGNACTSLRFQIQSSTAPTPVARYDFANNVIFRHKDWCRFGDPVGSCSYDSSALAITTIFVNFKDGLIRDADIEVNARNFLWGDVTLDPAGSTKQDLQNTLTRQLGHVIGLDAPCFVPGPDPPGGMIDNLGHPAPSCEAAPAEMRETTMFPSSAPGEISKRTLAPDDVLGVCGSYPRDGDGSLCFVVDGDASVDGDGNADLDVAVDGDALEAAGRDLRAEGDAPATADAAPAVEGDADAAGGKSEGGGGCGCRETGSSGSSVSLTLVWLGLVILAKRRIPARRP
jgi:hypothetical protein